MPLEHKKGGAEVWLGNTHVILPCHLPSSLEASKQVNEASQANPLLPFSSRSSSDSAAKMNLAAM